MLERDYKGPYLYLTLKRKATARVSTRHPLCPRLYYERLYFAVLCGCLSVYRKITHR